MKNLKPIKMLPARERVAAALRKAIMVHELEEGQELTLESVSDMLGVSSTPVREAFQMLSRDGFIKLRPNKGAIVLGMNEKSISDHYEARALLEEACARALCNNDSDLTELIDIVEEGKRIISEERFEAYSDNNQAFHVAVWEAGGNGKIKDLLSSMWNGLSMAQNVTEESYARMSLSEHIEMLEVFVRRDEQEAGRLMHQHIYRSLDNILTHFNISD